MAAKKIANAIHQLLLGANIMSALGMLATGYSCLIDPLKFPLLATADMFFPAFLAVNVIFFFFWLLLDKKSALLPIATLLVCYVPVRTYVGINLPADVPEGAIKVMSYNAMNFHGVYNEFTDEEKDEMADFLVDADCDILCLQEATETSMTENGRKKMKAKYPYSRTDNRGDNGTSIAVYSKYRILQADTISFVSKSNVSAAYILDTPVGKTLVVNNHLESCHLTPEERTNFKELISGDTDGDFIGAESKDIIAKLTESSLVRNAQAKAVAKYVDRYRGMPVILCGDFNDTPTSFNHRVMKGDLTDCFVASGTGLGWTYCHNGMRVRIDNIMCSRHFKPYSCKVLSHVTYSDHYPIVCWLKPTETDRANKHR